MNDTVSRASFRLSATIATALTPSVSAAGRLNNTTGMPASFAALIAGMHVRASFGTKIIPSTLRVMKVRICCSCRLESPSAIESTMSIPRFSSSLRIASNPATQYSVCRVSKFTPMVNRLPPPSGVDSGARPHPPPTSKPKPTSADNNRLRRAIDSPRPLPPAPRQWFLMRMLF